GGRGDGAGGGAVAWSRRLGLGGECWSEEAGVEDVERALELAPVAAARDEKVAEARARSDGGAALPVAVVVVVVVDALVAGTDSACTGKNRGRRGDRQQSLTSLHTDFKLEHVSPAFVHDA